MRHQRSGGAETKRHASPAFQVWERGCGGRVRTPRVRSVGPVGRRTPLALQRPAQQLARCRAFAHALGIPAQSRYAVGTEVAVEAELGKDLLGTYPKALVVAGRIIFDQDTAWNRLLHNETAFTIQRRQVPELAA